MIFNQRFRLMKSNILIRFVIAGTLLVAGSANATVIDDFESFDPLNYTTTVILDNGAGGSNTSALGAVGGEVVFETTFVLSLIHI